MKGPARGIALGLTCGRLCVLRQCFNRQYQSCPIIKNMFVKVKTKSVVSYIVDVTFLKVWNTKITYDITLFMSKRRTNCHMSYFENCVFSLLPKGLL